MSSKNAKPHPIISRLGHGEFFGSDSSFFHLKVGTNSTAVVTENKSIHRHSKTFHPNFLTNLSHECLCLYVNACLCSMSAKTNLTIAFSPWLWRTIGCGKQRSRDQGFWGFLISPLISHLYLSCKPLLGTRNMWIRLNKHRHPKQINCAFVSPNVWLSGPSPKKNIIGSIKPTCLFPTKPANIQPNFFLFPPLQRWYWNFLSPFFVWF